ncbi:MAG: S8 family serine peptidase [candidate division WOR-3 bacterium]|nr:MAG: S8 family serine peptidase [candidate division WOR-3 bacterium]
MKLLSLFGVVAMLGAVTHQMHRDISSLSTVPDANTTIISLSNGIVFDTQDGEPVLPQGLSRSHYDADGYYLVQVKGPVYRAWIDELKSCGLQIFGYIPHYALIVFGAEEDVNAVASKPFVRWIGIFQPAYKIQKDLLTARGIGRVSVLLFPREDAHQIGEAIDKGNFDVVSVIDHEIAKTVEAVGDLKYIDEIARIPGVQWIQLHTEPFLCNEDCQWTVQTGWRASVPPDPGARRIWHEGLLGDGLVLSTTDTGINTRHDQYYDALYDITAPGLYPDHRKIVAYKLFAGADFGEDISYHGSHVNCTVAGNDTLIGTSLYDGMAKHAKLYFLDIATSSGYLVCPDNLTPMYDTLYLGLGLGYNILQHSGSWGWYNSTGCYLIQDASTDAYVWEHPDFLNLYAAGNEGSAMSVRNPGIAKNVLTVGATLDGTSANSIAQFSSRGLTQDRRFKPTIMAPGDGLTMLTGLWSADGATNQGYIQKYGTSMATPAANGAVGLIRQYLLAGYYPSGAENPADSITYQSAALLRAMAIVSCDPNVDSWFVPDSNIGWGRIDVDSVLYFSGDTRTLIIRDDSSGLTTEQSITDYFMVNSAIPLRVCVAWTDTAAAPNANPTLVNDINVTLTAPSGTQYHGNIYSDGQSIPNPVIYDNRNVEECCRIDSPEPGFWSITITGYNIPCGPQTFAYVITGDVIDSVPGIVENNSVRVSQTGITFYGSIVKDKLRFELVLNSPRTVRGRIYDLTGRVVYSILDKQMSDGTHRIEENLNLASGVYFVEIDTGDVQKMTKILVIR